MHDADKEGPALAGGLRVFPPRVCFEDVQPNVLYVLTLLLQNGASKAERIRFRHPKSNYFTLNYTATGAVAPGLEVRAEVEFCIPDGLDDKEFHDELVVMCAGHETAIPLVGQRPCPRLEIEGNGLVDLGTVVRGNTQTRFLELRNTGSLPGDFTISEELGECLSVFPKEGTIPGTSTGSTRLSERLKVEFSSDTLGSFRKSVTLEIAGQAPLTLDVCANVVDQNLELVMPANGGLVDGELAFAALHFGQKATQEIMLVNNSPVSCQYSIAFKAGTGFELYRTPVAASAESLISTQSDDAEADGLPAGFVQDIGIRDAPIRMTPTQGVLAPYTKIPLAVVFAPRPPPQAKGFRARGDQDLHSDVSFELSAVVTCVDTGQQIPLKLTARALKPLVSINRKTFKFGTCAAVDRRDIVFTIANKGEVLPIRYSINKVAFFSCKPNAGRLLPGQSQNVLVSFMPAQLGSFRNTLHVVLCDGVRVVPLTVAGECDALGSPKKIPGGPEAILADFKPEIKYVDDDEVRRQARHSKPRFKRLPPWEKKKLAMREHAIAEDLEQPADSPSVMSANQLGAEDSGDLGPDVFGGVKSYDPTYTYSTADLVRKQQHRDQYADFLIRARRSRQDRAAKKAKDAKSPRSSKNAKWREEAKKASFRPGKHRHDHDENSSDEEADDDAEARRGLEDDPINIGLDPREGLRSPRLRVPAEPEPLWLERPLDDDGAAGDGNGASGGRRRHRGKTHDENRLIKRKFKDAPTSQSEITDCRSVITPIDLAHIGVQPKQLDFGTVCVNSKSAKCLAIANDLMQNILVEICVDGVDELSHSTPKAQVIPPGSQAGFDIIFSSSTQPAANQSNRFRKSITYIINGHHKFKYSIVAEVVPIRIALSTSCVDLRFDETNLNRSVSETVTLTNTGNASAYFSWVAAAPSSSAATSDDANSNAGSKKRGATEAPTFKIEPETDVIEPFETKDVVVTYAPVVRGEKTKNLALRVRGGYDEMLECVGHHEEPTCIFTQKKLDFGFVSVGREQTAKLDVKNTGSYVAVLFAEDAPPGISVLPETCKIPPGATATLEVRFEPASPCKLDPSKHQLRLALRGGRDLRLPLHGEAVVPVAEVLQAQTDFGGITIGSKAVQTITLSNSGDVPAVLTLDLSEHFEFEVALAPLPTASGQRRNSSFAKSTNSASASSRRKSIGGTSTTSSSSSRNEAAETESEGKNDAQALVHEDDEALDASSVGEIVDPDDLENLLRPVSAISNTRAPLGTFLEDEPAEDLAVDDIRDLDEECVYFEIQVPAKKRLHIQLIFVPKNERSHAFQLPLAIAGTSEVLQHAITGEGLRPKLLLSSTLVNFDTKVVSKDRLKKVPTYREISVTNHHDETLRWEIGTEPLSNMEAGADDQNATKFFSVKPTGGVLQPGDTCMVKVGFLPSGEEQYCVSLPIFIDEDREREYLSLELVGMGVYPKLRFDTSEVVLPTVPLGVKAKGVFYIQNDGYDSLDLRYRLPAETQRVPLAISFPEGKNIGLSRPQIPVEVTFTSRKPMSFTAKVDFVDTDGNAFGIYITGTAENCLLTAFPFVAAVRAQFDYTATASDRSVQFVPRPNAQLLLQSKKTHRESTMSLASQLDLRPPGAAESKEKPGDEAKNERKGTSKPAVDFVADASLVETASASATSVHTLVRFLNVTALQVPITDFPADLISSSGKQVFELIQSLSGKAAPGRMKAGGAKGKAAAVKKDLTKDLLMQYEALLKFLKSRGALLHDIRPEHFLPRDEYIRHRARTDPEMGLGDGAGGSSGMTMILQGSGMSSFSASNSQAHARILQQRHQLEREFPPVSTNAWASVILQILKLFVLNRVTVKQLRGLPGCTDAISPEDVRALSSSSSNIYSVPEGILLHWLSLHCSQGSNTILSSGGGGMPAADVLMPGQENPYRHNSPIVNLDTDLGSGVVLATLLASHIPTLIRPGCALASVVLEPTDETQCVANLTAVMNAMQELGLHYTRNPEDMLPTVANARDNLLFVLYLYQNLPQFVPKATIEFSCSLGSKVTKAIELRNPSSQLVSYDVQLDGSFEFSVPVRTVSIEAGETAELPVELTSRFSRPAEAILSLKPDRAAGGGSGGGPGGAPSALVFKLTSHVHSRRSIRTIKCATRAYEPLPVEVQVTNPFSQDARFVVELVQERTKEELRAPRGKAGKKRGGKAGAGAGAGLARGASKRGSGKASKRPMSREGTGTSMMSTPCNETLPDAFHCKLSTLKLRAGETATLSLQYLPFLPGEYRCQLVFVDEKVGEFLYEVIGEAARPVPLEKITFATEAKSVFSKRIALGMGNKLLEKAKTALAAVSSDGAGIEFTGRTFKNPDSVDFEVEFESPFFSGPSSVTVAAASSSSSSSSSSGPPKASGAASSSLAGSEDRESVASTKEAVLAVTNALTVDFQPQSAGVYPCYVILRSPKQIRIIELEATVSNPTVTSELDFLAPARQKIKQGIPILNTTDVVWNIQARLEGSACFTAPRSLSVSPDGGAADFTLEFAPTWVGEFSGKLILHNATTNEDMIYVLSGVGQEPLAEDHIVIECKAREKVFQAFAVSNNFGSCSDVYTTFAVESDLPHVGGDPTISVAKGASADYMLTVNPLLGGTYTGSVTFSLGPERPFLWYTVEIRATSPAPEDTLEITTFVRKAVAVEITLVNPLDQAVEFEVSLQGHGLLGEPRFVLEASEAASYELIYSPLVAGEVEGAVSFVNDMVGEVWYKLALSAQAAPPESLELFRCAVGTHIRQAVVLENPTDEAVELRAVLSNRRNFSVRPANPTLAPYAQTSVEIEYLPSSIGEEESGVVKFTSPKLGEWEFHVVGEGTMPSIMDNVEVSTSVGNSDTSSVVFRNPFQDPLQVVVEIETDGSDTLRMLLGRARQTVAPFANLMIPFSFTPLEMSEQTAKVRVHAPDRDTTWEFPIRAFAEAPPHPEIFYLTTRARDALMETVELPLLGLNKVAAPEPFMHELIVPEAMQGLVAQSLTLTPLETRISRPNQVIPFKVSFHPLKPFSTSVDLLISKRSGGRWRFQIRLDAAEPVIDDVIEVQASLHHTASVSFQLKNQFNVPAPFEAYLTVESAYQFSVYPTNGVLPPVDGQEGSTFVVSFTPTEYGKVIKAKLVIVTDEMQWSYLLRGTHPDFKPPAGEAKVVSRPDTGVLKALQDAQAKRKTRRNSAL
ncbi:Cilia- and flagella-associated protein 65 [Hondaea fermentalgiana]|uniref:Cilia-and flagella-associated protein 65 n=1 Tax=Hondaea fermentalgiana TaxID=2315210 RepID=A0A2R5GBW7_9STRA|nr:Cilia- and flagella-associated protein 65 [Hondaea fermentalgiana]|eukprot:GBG28496.1 Cilia- and flagella-associated protein 65 [Hondaea fermentalgiana]